MEKILHFAVEKRWLVLSSIPLILFIGLYQSQNLTINAVPDISNIQVQINSEAIGYSPLEVEQRITFPIETAMAGIPHRKYTRSLSRYGLSQVTIIFDETTDIYFARQLVSERLLRVKEQIPDHITPTLGPISTGLGEVFSWVIQVDDNAKKNDNTPYSLQDLREIQDWIIKPQMVNVVGVTEINTIGGSERKYQVSPDPQKMLAYNVTLQDIMIAITNNNNNLGAGYIEKNGEQYLVRSPGQLSTLEDIRNLSVKSFQGTPIYLSNVSTVHYGQEQQTGSATYNGKESVIGTVFMLTGENSMKVAKDSSEQLKKINHSLPPGVQATEIYNRTSLIEKTISTVRKNLLEGAFLVIFILFIFLGNLRAALITAAVIPLSMLMTTTGMATQRISGNLMSLGAIDFGLIVDGAVIIVENCISRLNMAQQKSTSDLTLRERLDTVFSATKEVRSATMFGEMIITIVYFPILTLSGIEGKMFYPMAITVIIALISAMLLSVTFVPAAIACFLRPSKNNHHNSKVINTIINKYKQVLISSLHESKKVISFSCGIFLMALIIACKMGTEFIPQLGEGDIALHALRIPGTSLTQSTKMQTYLEKKILEIPEVQHVFSKIGTSEVASDPMPPNVADTFVILKPKSSWSPGLSTQKDIVEILEKKIQEAPGNNYEITQPIQMRFNEMISGVRADVAVKIFGDNMDILQSIGLDIKAQLEKINGSSDTRIEQVDGLPSLSIHINRQVISRMSLSLQDVQNTIHAALAGEKVGKIYQGDRRFDIIVRLNDSLREDLSTLKNLAISIPDHGDFTNSTDNHSLKGYIPLGQIADIQFQNGPNQISRENGKRLLNVTTNIRGRDLGSFIEKTQIQIEKNVEIPPSYWINRGGQFEHMISAVKKLKIVIPMALFLILILLMTSFGNIVDSLIVFACVPLALTGGILAIWARGIPLSISAGIGFIALSGIAVLNGLVLITFINQLIASGKDLYSAVIDGATSRLRPVLMTALVAALGFIPMALATGTGAEVQRPLATVVIGGIISSTCLTLILLPCLYLAIKKTHEK
ncbi:MAG: efflux RND transporter permease subunit [Oligoflexales bacterium]